MKKFVKVLALVLCLMLALTACGKGSYISFDDVYNDLTTDIDFGGNMAEMSEIAAENFYFIYDTDIMEEFGFTWTNPTRPRMKSLSSVWQKKATAPPWKPS